MFLRALFRPLLVAATSIASGSPTMEVPNLKIEEKVVMAIMIR
jgi:hypothetical protein